VNKNNIEINNLKKKKSLCIKHYKLIDIKLSLVNQRPYKLGSSNQTKFINYLLYNVYENYLIFKYVGIIGIVVIMYDYNFNFITSYKFHNIGI